MNAKKTNMEFDTLPHAAEFCLQTPLYKKYRFDNTKENPFFSLEHFDGTLDMHCLGLNDVSSGT